MAERSSSNPTAATSEPVLIPLAEHIGKPPIPLNRPFTLVGSRHNCHLHLLSRHISKAHAALLRTETGVYVRDLASRERVYVNGQPVAETVLNSGDELQIGHFKFQFRLAPGLRSPPVQPLPIVHVEIEGGEIPVPMAARTLLIGRKPNCDIPLIEASVSTTHAVIFEMDGKRWVRDLGSRTGTFVNGQQVKTSPLNLGDKLKIGETTMRLVPAKKAAPAPADKPAGDPNDSIVAVKATASQAFAGSAPTRATAPKPAPAEVDDEFESMLGTAPLEPEAPLPPQHAPPLAPAHAARPSPAEPAKTPSEVDLSVVDLDAEMNSPADTARLPAEPEEKRKRPPTPRLAASVEDHIDLDDHDQRMLVDPSIGNDKLSSSATHADLGEAAAEAMELAGEKSPGQSLAVSSADVLAEEHVDIDAPVKAPMAAPIAAAPVVAPAAPAVLPPEPMPAAEVEKELEFSTRSGWRKQKTPLVSETVETPIPPTPEVVAPEPVEVKFEKPIELTPIEAEIEPAETVKQVEAPLVQTAAEIQEVQFTSSALRSAEPETAFDDLELTPAEEPAQRMDFEVQVPREPEQPKKKPPGRSAGKKAAAKVEEPKEIDLSGVTFDEPLVEAAASVDSAAVAETDISESTPTVPLVNLGALPVEASTPAPTPNRRKRVAAEVVAEATAKPLAEAPVEQPKPIEPAPAIAPAPMPEPLPVAAIAETISLVEPKLISAPAAAEVISATEPSPEAAQALAPVVLASVEASALAAVESASLTDTSFGRAVEEFVGESLGPIVEQKSEPPPIPPTLAAPVEPPPVIEPAAIERPPVIEPSVIEQPVVAAMPVVEPTASEPEAEPEQVTVEAILDDSFGKPVTKPPIVGGLLSNFTNPVSLLAGQADDESQEQAADRLPGEDVLADLLNENAVSLTAPQTGPMFNLTGNAESASEEDDGSEDTEEDSYDGVELDGDVEEDEESEEPLFKTSITRLPPPPPRRQGPILVSSIEPDVIRPAMNLSAAPEQTSLDEILSWGTPSTYMSGTALHLPELPEAPDHFGKVGVSFGESDLRVDPGVRAPFEIVQSSRTPMQDQPAPVFQQQPQPPKQKPIRPLSDKSRRPRPVQGMTQRRPKPMGPKPIGMPDVMSEPEPVLDPTISSFSPVFGATLPEAMGAGATVFGGLSMSPVRELDVFSQMSRSSIPIDPFTGATPEDIMQEASRPPQKGTPRKRAAQQPPARRPPQSPPLPGARQGASMTSLSGDSSPLPADPMAPPLGAEDGPHANEAAAQVLGGLTSALPIIRGGSDIGVRPGRAPVKPKGLPPRVDPAARGAAAANAAAGANGQPAYPVMKKRRRWLSTPWLILAMLMTTAAAAAATWHFVPVQYKLMASLEYTNLNSLTRAQRDQFFNGIYMQNPAQKRLLDEARLPAAQMVMADGRAPGFLGDPEQFARMVDSPDTVKWPIEIDNNNNSNVQPVRFAFWSNDLEGDKARLKALLSQLYLANMHRANNGGDIQRAIATLKDEIVSEQAEVDNLNHQIAEAQTTASAAVTADQLVQLEKERDAAQTAHAAAYQALITAQQALDSARQQAGQTSPDILASTTQPSTAEIAAADPQLADAQKRLDEMSRRLDAAKKYAASEAERNRKALEASIEQFNANMGDVQQLVKDNPSLQQYLLSAQKLQDYVQKLSGDMLDHEQRDVDYLLDLKRSIDEQLERQRNDRYDNDKELADLMVQKASVERQANAASAQGYTKEAADKELEKKSLEDKIAARKQELANDPTLTSASQKLQDQIAMQQKQLASDREENDKAMKQLEKDLAESAPAVSNMTKQQQDVANKMSSNIQAMNNARKIYSESLAARDEESNADLKSLQETVEKYAAEVEDRKKEIALAGGRKLTDDQQQARQALVAQKQGEYETAKAAEAAASKDSFEKFQAADRAARQANISRDAQAIVTTVKMDRDEKQADLEAKKSALATKSGDLEKVVAVNPPADPGTTDSSDARPFDTMVAGFSVVAFFSLVILANHLAQSREPKSPNAPAAVESIPVEPDPSLANAAPDPIFGGGGKRRQDDVHALESDEDIDPIVA